MTSNTTHTECVAISDVGTPRAVRIAYVRQSVPNPATRHATIEFGLPAPAPVRVGIYDLSGRMIRTLIDGRLEAGVHFATWDLRTADGSPATSGVYFYRVSAGPYRVSKVLVVRSR